MSYTDKQAALLDQTSEVLGPFARPWLVKIDQAWDGRINSSLQEAILDVFGLKRSQMQDRELFEVTSTAGFAVKAAKYILKNTHGIDCYKGWLPPMPIPLDKPLTLFQVNVLSYWIISVVKTPRWKWPKLPKTP